MTTFLVFVAVLAAGGVALVAAGLPDLPGLRRFRPPRAAADRIVGESLAEPDPRLPAVLLPEHPSASDIGKLRFSVGLRGYRMDQVDAVLARLATALADRDAALEAAREPPGGEPGGPGAPGDPGEPDGRP